MKLKEIFVELNLGSLTKCNSSESTFNPVHSSGFSGFFVMLQIDIHRSGKGEIWLFSQNVVREKQSKLLLVCECHRHNTENEDFRP